MNETRTDGAPGFSARPWLPYALLTAAMVIYGTNYVLGRALRDDIPPFAIAFWRALFACLVLAPFIGNALQRNLSVIVRHWRLFAVLAATQTVIGQGFLFAGLHSTTAINASLIASLQPVFILIFAVFLIGERSRAWQRVGVAIGFAGGLVAVTRGEVGVLIGLDFAPGDILVLIATVGWSVYSVLVKRLPAELDPYSAFFAFTAFGAIALLPIHLGEAVLLETYFTPSIEIALGVLYIAVLNGIVALVFLNIGIARIGPSRASAFYYLMPVATAFFAVLILGETIAAYHFVGLGLVVLGVFFTSRRGAS